MAEYAVIAGGPIIIYIIRLALSTYYDYRTSNLQVQADDLQTQRDRTIEKLKTATKYNSTQELLKKYGGTPTPKSQPTQGSNRKVTPKQQVPSEKTRTQFIPPPTANIPGREELFPRQVYPQHAVPQMEMSQAREALNSPLQDRRSPQTPSSPLEISAEFAPNAFPAPPQYAQVNEGSRWYDRLMDVLLGEDETRPGARLALICSQCRLVNGQAPPGMKRLEDLGKWRCGGCGAMNGEESEMKKIVSSIEKASQDEVSEGQEQSEKAPKSSDEDYHDASSSVDEESDVTQYSTEQSDEQGGKRGAQRSDQEHIASEVKADAPKRRSTRSTKGKKPG
ncbi:hypothetical protein ACLMJK_004396 [Lecanora helva]